MGPYRGFGHTGKSDCNVHDDVMNDVFDDVMYDVMYDVCCMTLRVPTEDSDTQASPTAMCIQNVFSCHVVECVLLLQTHRQV